MTACNLRPPEGHPFHGSGVACHLPAGHKGDNVPHSWEILPPSPWAARFRDGPCVDDERVWVVGDPWEWLVLAPIASGRGHHWVIVGGTGIGGPPEEPWVGQATYRLVDVEPGLVVGEWGRVAYYVLADSR